MGKRKVSAQLFWLILDYSYRIPYNEVRTWNVVSQTKIMMSRILSGSEFAEQQLAQGHEVRALRLYDRNALCSTIYADFTAQTVIVENQAVPTIKTAFGNNLLPNWEDFQRFLEERCIPRQRAGLREYLETLGLDEYDPLAIIEKTGGRMAEDQQWLTIEVLK